MADLDVKDFTLGTAKTLKTSTVGGKEYTHHVIADTTGNAVGVTANAQDINIKSGNPTTMPSTVADGASVTLGSKGDAKSTATDTTAITVMQVMKQISASVQAPPSQAVTNAGTFAVQAAATEADGANVTLGAKADAKSIATDTTSVSVMSVLKQISASVQAPPSQAVTNAGTFAVQSTIAAAATNIAKAEDVASADADVGVPAMAVRKATPANTSGTDGDYEMLQISAGSAWVASVATDKTLVSERVIAGGSQYETVAASQTDQALGATGATGDYLESLICVVATAATSQVQIKDGAGSAITILPNAVGAGIGTYILPVGLISLAGAWKVTTAAGVSVIGTGRFT